MLDDVAENEDGSQLFTDEAYLDCRLDHVTQVMGYHPTYLNIFLRTQDYILRRDGPLSYEYRHYIAIMAAGRHQCSYLINLQKEEFLSQGGNQVWLKGLNNIPKKLRDLYEVNKILAHRPWLLNPQHLQKLNKNGWSLGELCHALVLLVHFHSLASFVFACGVNEELDNLTDSKNKLSDKQKEGKLTKKCLKRPGIVDDGDGLAEGGPDSPPRSLESDSPPSPDEAEVGLETLMERMKKLSQLSQEFSPEEKIKRFNRVESQSAELGAAPPPLASYTTEVEHVIDDVTYTYIDFARRDSDGLNIPTFRIQDYSWDDHGYSLINRYYNDVGNVLDEKFKIAYNLTYYTLAGRTQVDTSRFRRAIWNYVQCLFGKYNTYTRRHLELCPVSIWHSSR
uniref:Sestrin homolog n=1 Tax=Cacopsylla melanoneura TaxID=428564 RepID=A0A8D8UXZ2_9HEMI